MAGWYVKMKKGGTIEKMVEREKGKKRIKRGKDDEQKEKRKINPNPFPIFVWRFSQISFGRF